MLQIEKYREQLMIFDFHSRQILVFVSRQYDLLYVEWDIKLYSISRLFVCGRIKSLLSLSVCLSGA